MKEKPPSRASPPSNPVKLPKLFEFCPAGRLPPKPRGQLGIQYGTGAACAWAVRSPRQSAVNTNAKPSLPAKIDIRTTVKYGETILSGYRERQRGTSSLGFRPQKLPTRPGRGPTNRRISAARLADEFPQSRSRHLQIVPRRRHSRQCRCQTQ